MPRVEAIAKRDMYPAFMKGDKVTIVPVLYEEDTLVRDEIHGIFKGEKMIKIFEKNDLKHKWEGCEIRKIFDKVYAPKGSYKDSYIETANGTYPSSLVRRYEDFFEKVKN